MNKLFIDLTDKPDSFKIKLLPTSYSTSYTLRSRITKNHVYISINYYNGITKVYKAIKAPLNCDLKMEENKLKESISNFIKITDTFNILKKDLTNDIINKFRWCQPLIEYEECTLPIDPYILGLWLGDGDSNGINLTSIDNVIIDYWKKYAKINDLNININGTKERKTIAKNGETELVSSYRIYTQTTSNKVLVEFKKLNLINNKHIPEIFLKNSINNRLKLLAGIIDTDGYLDGNSRYEIVQKNNKLSENILELSRSLGFFCTLNIKKSYASNSKLKTIRDYNRIIIYINQINLEIPVLLERKKSKCTDKTQFYNPKILINNNIMNERIIWNIDLENLLIESVKCTKKPIPWKLIKNEVIEFNKFSHEALRKKYQLIRKKMSN
jgi:hypothetical protein